MSEHPCVTDVVEGSHDTLPIISTFRNGSRLSVLVIRLKVSLLNVLRAMRRKGRLYLILILPDGSKSLIPADWTDFASPTQPQQLFSVHTTATLGSVAGLASRTRHHQTLSSAALRR